MKLVINILTALGAFAMLMVFLGYGYTLLPLPKERTCNFETVNRVKK